MSILLLSEFINKNGGRIGGDYKIDQDNAMTTSPTEPPVTTDDFVKATRQGMSRYMYRSFYGENDETTDGVEEPEEDKEKKYPSKPKGKSKTKPKTPSPWKKPKERQPSLRVPGLKEEANLKMDSLIEDIFKKKDFDKEFVEKRKYDLRLNGIQDLESLRETNPILIRKVKSLRDTIEKGIASGEEKAIILNYLLDMDLLDIPREYKEELKKKIR
jgi:hypothetical protein